MLSLVLLLLTPVADPTPIVVVNKCPPVITVVNKTPAVVKAKAVTFRGVIDHVRHNCPNCGEERTKLDSGVLRGWHNHKCQSCGTVWRHKG